MLTFLCLASEGFQKVGTDPASTRALEMRRLGYIAQAYCRSGTARVAAQHDWRGEHFKAIGQPTAQE
jgi:hypothetical protein